MSKNSLILTKLLGFNENFPGESHGIDAAELRAMLLDDAIAALGRVRNAAYDAGASDVALIVHNVANLLGALAGSVRQSE